MCKNFQKKNEKVMKIQLTNVAKYVILSIIGAKVAFVKKQGIFAKNKMILEATLWRRKARRAWTE